MKKYFLAAFLLLLVFQANAQSRGIKIGYIDMEYILQNVPDYAEANSQLEQKAQKWKQDIEAKKIEIAKLKDALKTEKALLYPDSWDDISRLDVSSEQYMPEINNTTYALYEYDITHDKLIFIGPYSILP